ncbi:MAG: hypothetical protein LBK59_12535 [Bifidobacteriaceae bacterium]|nr:hypothetical protein [Bifidobacteriaceae bacterium]
MAPVPRATVLDRPVEPEVATVTAVPVAMNGGPPAKATRTGAQGSGAPSAAFAESDGGAPSLFMPARLTSYPRGTGAP